MNLVQKGSPENPRLDLTNSQKLKDLRLGLLTLTRQITKTTYKIREDVNPNNVKTMQRNQLIEYFPKVEQLHPLITNYDVIRSESDFYIHLVNSQIEQYTSGREKHSLDVMPSDITPLRNNSKNQQKMISIFHLEQTPEYNRLQVRYNNRWEIKTQVFTEAKLCLPYPNYNHTPCHDSYV